MSVSSIGIDNNSENSYSENASQLGEEDRVSVISDSVFTDPGDSEGDSDSSSCISTSSINERFLEENYDKQN